MVRKFGRFVHGKRPFALGVPVVASNMDTVGTFDMALKLAIDCKCFTCLHKHYTLDEWVNFRNKCLEMFPENSGAPIFDYVSDILMM